MIAKYRPKAPIIAVTTDNEVLSTFSISMGRVSPISQAAKYNRRNAGHRC